FNTTCTFLLNKGPGLEAFLGKFGASKILPERELEELLTHYARVATASSSLDPDTAPSHNDLFKPDSILFDGIRPWLVHSEASVVRGRHVGPPGGAGKLARAQQSGRTSLC